MQTIQHNRKYFFCQIKKSANIFLCPTLMRQTFMWWEQFGVFVWIEFWWTHKPNWSRAGTIRETDRRWHWRSCWGGMWPCCIRVMWLRCLRSEPKHHVWASHILMFLSPLSATHGVSLLNPPFHWLMVAIIKVSIKLLLVKIVTQALFSVQTLQMCDWDADYFDFETRLNCIRCKNITSDSGFPYSSARGDATLGQYSAHDISKLSKVISVDICQLALVHRSEPLVCHLCTFCSQGF